MRNREWRPRLVHGHRAVEVADGRAGCVHAAVVLMDDVLFSALRDATYGWLNRLEILIWEADLPSRAALAETEMGRMIGAWRALLAEHEPNEEGRCPRCPGRRRTRRRNRCAVWVTAHRHLVLNDAGSDGSARHAMSPGREGAAW
jgi:hypothetical protein